jgi:ArsR family transcriptional regulator
MARAGVYKDAAGFFQVLAHPGRLRILDELRRGQACVCHLQTVLNRPQAYVSQQLRVLREAGIVSGERDGLNVYYRISRPDVLDSPERQLGATREPTRLPHCPCPYCRAAYEGAAPVEQSPAA